MPAPTALVVVVALLSALFAGAPARPGQRPQIRRSRAGAYVPHLGDEPPGDDRSH